MTATDLDALCLHAAARGEEIVYTPPDGYELIHVTASSGPARVVYAVTVDRVNRYGVRNDAA